MENQEYRVVWFGPQREGEAIAIGPMAAMGYGDWAKTMGAEIILIVHNGVNRSLEEFEKTWGQTGENSD